jgi:hypothetical protein
MLLSLAASSIPSQDISSQHLRCFTDTAFHTVSGLGRLQLSRVGNGAHPAPLELDSKVTLGVLCDQIVSLYDPMEDEDKAIRERLRELVIAFLTEDCDAWAPRATAEPRQHGAEQERALMDTLLKATSTHSFQIVLLPSGH